MQRSLRAAQSPDRSGYDTTDVSGRQRSLQGRRTWQREIIAVWQGQIHSHHPIDFAFVDPDPPRLPWMSPSAHLLLTQRAEDAHALVLVSTMLQQPDGPVLLQCMHHLANRVSTADIVAANLPEGIHGPGRVRRRDQVFPAISTAGVGNGDSIESDILPTTMALQPDETEDSAMLQLPPVPLLSHHTPVTLSLDATIPPVPANDLHDVGYPELLFS